MTERAWIGLGANLGEPRRMVERALAALDELPESRRVAASSLYATPPMGPPDQPDYINAVAAVDTQLAPQTLLEELLALETRLGRRRDPAAGERWGPRVIDLDLLCYGARFRDDGFLTLPHPGIGERAFVLVPWAEIAPQAEIPGQGRVAELLEGMETDGVERIGG